MSSALEAFRAQREAADHVHERLVEVTTLLQSANDQADRLAKNDDWLQLLRQEETWLVRAHDLVTRVEQFRRFEASRFWPAVWRRWAVAVVFGCATSAAAAGGYAWVSRPYAAELTELRSRVELLDYVAQRVLKMTPAERREFDALMKFNESHKR
jgi:hypothetical protein